jgi:BMFP domain-containing protein YqiC
LLPTAVSDPEITEPERAPEPAQPPVQTSDEAAAAPVDMAALLRLCDVKEAHLEALAEPRSHNMHQFIDEVRRAVAELTVCRQRKAEFEAWGTKLAVDYDELETRCARLETQLKAAAAAASKIAAPQPQPQPEPAPEQSRDAEMDALRARCSQLEAECEKYHDLSEKFRLRACNTVGLLTNVQCPMQGLRATYYLFLYCSGLHKRMKLRRCSALEVQDCKVQNVEITSTDPANPAKVTVQLRSDGRMFSARLFSGDPEPEVIFAVGPVGHARAHERIIELVQLVNLLL